MDGKWMEATMDVTQKTNDEQAKFWNGFAGRGWGEAQDVLDRMLVPFEDHIVDSVSVGPGGRVLDVGCGTGSTTLAVARVLGANGHCTGVDISEPMLAVARQRTERDSTAPRFASRRPAGWSALARRLLLRIGGGEE
jgi:SAM-dependent methyltransferase